MFSLPSAKVTIGMIRRWSASSTWMRWWSRSQSAAAQRRLEARTRSVARLDRALSPALKIAARIEDEASQALDEALDGCDLMLFPGSVQGPHPIGRFHDRGAIATGYLDTSAVAFQPLWNLVGRPAAMVPWGFDRDGLPTAVQFGGRPGAERLLLSLVSQLESHRGTAPSPAMS